MLGDPAKSRNTLTGFVIISESCRNVLGACLRTLHKGLNSKGCARAALPCDHMKEEEAELDNFWPADKTDCLHQPWQQYNIYM